MIPSLPVFPYDVWGFEGENRVFSNFYRVPGGVVLDGERYPTVENAYQAAKTPPENFRAEFTLCSPAAAKEMGNRRPLRKDWSDVKLPTMWNLLLQKFAPGTEELHRLQETEVGSHLIEVNDWNDDFWGAVLEKGDPTRAVGKNYLGQMLVLIREGATGELNHRKLVHQPREFRLATNSTYLPL